jgi:hypothetical protein
LVQAEGTCIVWEVKTGRRLKNSMPHQVTPATELAECVEINAEDISGLFNFENNIGLTVVQIPQLGIVNSS